MKSLLKARRPSPALVIALIALFVSLSGVSYGVATGYIDSREIKNNQVRSLDIRNNEIRTRDLRNNQVRGIDIRNSSVQGRDIALNTINGNDVNESTLDKVPSATSADTAGSAATAGSVGGIAARKFSYSAETGSDFVQILNFGGLVLEADCDNAGGPALVVRANPTAPNGEFASDFPGWTQLADQNFDPGDDFIVLDHNEGVGHARYVAASGAVVTIDAVAIEDQNDVRGTTNDCGFFGIAQAG